ncbi:hypothetical protein Y032_0528g2981 [Ancylostoma ceylanicum]|uniref:Uncharacterized protein n=1 Tax=Ancylostoma ceylanicum TaxID=53326 RepID=A0A016WU51_9BILA|nr:hypothetical protein Y032_0528g2981 [Ancylostoma ceylanicum]
MHSGAYPIPFLSYGSSIVSLILFSSGRTSLTSHVQIDILATVGRPSTVARWPKDQLSVACRCCLFLWYYERYRATS